MINHATSWTCILLISTQVIFPYLSWLFCCSEEDDLPGVPPVDPAADPSSDHADAGRDMSRALGGRLPPSLAAAWAALAAAPADGQERFRSREDRLLAAPLGLLRWTGEREPSRVRCWEEVEEDGDGEAIAALPFLVNKFMVLNLENLHATK